jgi:hypothetical protein
MKLSKGCGAVSSNPCAIVRWLDSASRIAAKQMLANPTLLILVLRGLSTEGANTTMANPHVGTALAR